MIRRPYMRPPLDEAEKDDRADLEDEQLRVRMLELSSLMTTPVSTGTRIPAIWEAIARSDETRSETR